MIDDNRSLSALFSQNQRYVHMSVPGGILGHNAVDVLMEVQGDRSILRGGWERGHLPRELPLGQAYVLVPGSEMVLAYDI